ncbi:nuclear transport factor 2 family protein [Aquabacterium sp.]|uniref:nuclear transport factor 2 family protein n=1 Tax=Aquabacterium sp. TaxID=1872578 RepID=UPI0040384B69
MSVTPMPSSRTDVAHQAMPLIVAFFENLKEEDLSELARLYAREARFKDPFNEVQGLLAIDAIFQHMFQTLDLPHFVVKERMAQGQQAFLTWDFRFRFKGQPNWQTIHGATRLQFDAQGLVVEHRDYWDAAEELYEKLPVLGTLLRWLKRRVMS